MLSLSFSISPYNFSLSSPLLSSLTSAITIAISIAITHLPHLQHDYHHYISSSSPSWLLPTSSTLLLLTTVSSSNDHYSSHRYLPFISSPKTLNNAFPFIFNFTAQLLPILSSLTSAITIAISIAITHLPHLHHDYRHCTSSSSPSRLLPTPSTLPVLDCHVRLLGFLFSLLLGFVRVLLSLLLGFVRMYIEARRGIGSF